MLYFHKVKNRILALVFGLVISLLLLEIACAVLTRTNYISARLPSYTMKDFGTLFWADINEEFGVWHLPNTQYRHQKSCFDVIYQSNSFGSRDLEQSRVSSESRVIVIGDSFVEGYGVERDKRFTERLSVLTGKPHLNFGTSGSFGATQAFLLYESMAKQFDHDQVIIAFLPDNDFDDDVRVASDRYAPFWQGEYPSYELKYSLDDMTKSSFSPDQIKFNWWREVQRNYTHIRNVGDFVSGILAYRRKHADVLNKNGDEPRSRFVQFSDEEYNRLVYSYEKIIKSANNKTVVLFTIPRVYDLQYYLDHQESPLGDKLNAWAKQYPQLMFIDLLPIMADKLSTTNPSSSEPSRDIFSIFHTCDGHWNDAGHAMAAELLYETLTTRGVYIAKDI